MKKHKNTVIYLIIISVLIGIIFLISKRRNSSPVVFSTKFYWEEGVDVEFRKNGTYKALNHNMFERDISYGKYKLKDSLIILEDKLRLGISNMNDTLIVSNDGVLFTMEKPWRINKGKMSFVYVPKTEIKILNNTNSVIDAISIKLPYTKQISKTVSIKPKQNANYEFDMTNPYVNGNYLLSYRIKALSSEVKQIGNILIGYPLESVESIRFEEEKIVISLIFGKKISITYI